MRVEKLTKARSHSVLGMPITFGMYLIEPENNQTFSTTQGL